MAAPMQALGQKVMRYFRLMGLQFATLLATLSVLWGVLWGK